MMKHCQNFKHGFPNIQARISDLQARPCLQARNISPWGDGLREGHGFGQRDRLGARDGLGKGARHSYRLDALL